MRYRRESFGAIVALEDPPALAWIDHDLARQIGVPGDRDARADKPWLSAPTEAHLMLTNRCPAGCPGCYTGAEPDEADAPTGAWKKVLDDLAAMGVFHVALGGGESLLRDDLFDIAEHARARGLVPNLTTSGIGMTRALAERCRVFGQVNVSLDGLGDVYAASRGYDGAGRALRALRLLTAAGVESGVNFVLSTLTWDHLEDTIRAVGECGGNEVEILRFKPAGRGRDVYEQYRLPPETAARLMDRLLELGERYPDVVVKIDCSLVPLLCAGGPDPAALERFGIFGCEAAHALSAVTHELEAIPCSFLPDAGIDAARLRADWDDDPTFGRYRHHHELAPEPCSSCAYRTMCKGGCRAVAAHLTGDPFAPDPECPRVIAHASHG